MLNVKMPLRILMKIVKNSLLFVLLTIPHVSLLPVVPKQTCNQAAESEQTELVDGM